MYVERIPNRNSPPAILLRESYRDGDKIRKRTLANLSDWPGAKVEALRCVLRGDAVAPVGAEALSMQRSPPHGHVAAALGDLAQARARSPVVAGWPAAQAGSGAVHRHDRCAPDRAGLEACDGAPARRGDGDQFARPGARARGGR